MEDRGILDIRAVRTGGDGPTNKPARLGWRRVACWIYAHYLAQTPTMLPGPRTRHVAERSEGKTAGALLGPQ